MKICASCFSDRELKGFISTSKELGDCVVCESKNQPLLDISELFDFFQALIKNFKLDIYGATLNSRLTFQWSFFSSKDTSIKILSYVLPNLKTDIDSPYRSVEYIDEIIENYKHWDILKKDLKWKNRYVINIERLEDLGWDGFFNTQFELKKETPLFRARLHHKSGLQAYDPKDMYCPPEKEIANGGRANPLGIPFLYLSDNPETVLYEVRASYLDELSVGTFKLKPEFESIKLVDFTEETSLYQSDYNRITDTIKSKILRVKIGNDLSKPMRRYDSELEYIPTQFICEFIKVYTGVHGIRFNSSLHPNGKNVVLFDQNLLTCISVKKVKINSVNLQGMEIKH